MFQTTNQIIIFLWKRNSFFPISDTLHNMSLLESESTQVRQQKPCTFWLNVKPLQGVTPYFPKLI